MQTTTTNLLTTYRSNFYENYTDYGYLGQGGFGIVVQATEKHSENKVAIKRVKLKMGAEQKVLNELKILCKLDHGNVVRYHNSWTEPIEYHKGRDEELFRKLDIISSSSSFTNLTITDQTEEKQKEASKSHEYLFIVTSLCEKKSLSDRLVDEYDSDTKIVCTKALSIFNQIVTGVAYLHNSMRLVHRDLKPANILFSLDNDTVKIADFGLALGEDLVPIEDGSNLNNNNQAGGTKFYMPPDGESISNKTDIYALGIILIELLYPFSSGSERITVLRDIRKSEIEFPEDFNEKYGNETLKSLIRGLVSHSPNDRPSISDLKENIEIIKIDIEVDKNALASKIENILRGPVVKQLPLATDDIKYGVFDTSDKYILLYDDCRLKLFNLNCELIDECSSLYDNRQAGYIQRIVWCQSLKQFLILCQYRLFAFAPDGKEKLVNMKEIKTIKPFGTNDVLRFVACTKDHVFINHSYHTIQQYVITTWFLYREWSKKRLNYEKNDDIRRTTCSTTYDYIAFNVRLDKRAWVIDFRRIDDDLSLIKRVQIHNLGIYHNLQLSPNEWLIIDQNSQFYVLDKDFNVKFINTNITSKSDFYTRFFGEYFIVPIIQEQDKKIQGIIYFYQW